MLAFAVCPGSRPAAVEFPVPECEHHDVCYPDPGPASSSSLASKSSLPSMIPTINRIA